MKALERLSFSGKFVLLGVLALTLIVVPTILYVLGALSSGRQAERELHGIAPVQALLHLVALTQQHQNLATTVLGGDSSLQQARLAKQAELQRSFEASEQTLRTAEVEADLLTALQQVREQWQALSEEIDQGSIKARQSMQRHTQLIASSLLIEDALLDHFELSLDPLLETYSLMNAALIEMPQTAELFSQLRGYGALYLVQGRILSEQQGALMGLTSQALASFERMNRVFAKAAAADPAIAAMLEEPLAALREQTRQALALSDQQLVFVTDLDFSGGGLKVTYPVADYLAAYDRPIEALHALGDSALALLEERLGERRDRHRQHLLPVGLFFHDDLGQDIMRDVLAGLRVDDDELAPLAGHLRQKVQRDIT
mgnify:CR=1 FL=1